MGPLPCVGSLGGAMAQPPPLLELEVAGAAFASHVAEKPCRGFGSQASASMTPPAATLAETLRCVVVG